MYVSIDLVEEVIERQLRKYKNKIVQREQGAGSFRQEFIDKEAEDEEVRIIRTKQFDMKPMYPEDACVQMEMLGHSFVCICKCRRPSRSTWFTRRNRARP